MKVRVFDYSTGEERPLPDRYLDEAIDSHCVGSEYELDLLHLEAVDHLQRERRFWLTNTILLKPYEGTPQ